MLVHQGADGVQHRQFFAGIAQEILVNLEAVLREKPQTYQKDERACASAQARCFSVQKQAAARIDRSKARITCEDRRPRQTLREPAIKRGIAVGVICGV